METSAKKIEYIELIKKSLRLAWDNKYLWWFGLFVALTSAGGSFNYSFDRNSRFETAISQKISDFIAHNLGVVFAIALILFILYIIFIILGVIGRGALIQSIEKVSTKKPADFKSGFSAGKKYFWRLFGLGLLISFSVLALIILIMLPIIFLFVLKSYIFGAILVLGALIILIPLIFIASYIRIYGYIYAVLGNLAIWSSVETAYALLRKNIVPSIIMTLIFIVLGIISSIAAILLIVPVALVFFVIGAALFLILKSVGIAIAVTLGVITALIVSLYFRSFYETFAQTVWILFFHEIADPKVEEKVAEAEKETVPEIKPATNPDVA